MQCDHILTFNISYFGDHQSIHRPTHHADLQRYIEATPYPVLARTICLSKGTTDRAYRTNDLISTLVLACPVTQKLRRCTGLGEMFYAPSWRLFGGEACDRTEHLHSNRQSGIPSPDRAARIRPPRDANFGI